MGRRFESSRAGQMQTAQSRSPTATGMYFTLGSPPPLYPVLAAGREAYGRALTEEDVQPTATLPAGWIRERPRPVRRRNASDAILDSVSVGGCADVSAVQR